MRLLEALKILEDATRDCKRRNIDKPEVREALDTIDPYCLPRSLVKEFREHLHPDPGQLGPDIEGQQNALRRVGPSYVLASSTISSQRMVFCGLRASILPVNLPA